MAEQKLDRVGLVTSGPGATNAITGVTAAFMDSVPMIVISGQVSTFSKKLNIRQLGFQEFDIINSIKSTTKYAVNLKNKNEVQYELEKACFLSNHGRPGPVWLDIPLIYKILKFRLKRRSFYKNKQLSKFNPSQKYFIKSCY